MNHRGWRDLKLKEVAEVRKEKFDPSKNENRTYIALEHIKSDAGVITDFGNSTDTTSIKSVFYKNDILFGKLRPYLKKYWFATFDGVCATEILSIKAKENILPKYLFYLMSSDAFINKVNSKTFGTKMPRASWKDMSDLETMVPSSLNEQKKIAAILSSVDEAMEKTEQIITQTEKVKKGLMQQLLTKGIGHTTFKKTAIGEIPKEWEIKPLSELATLNMGQSPNSSDCYDYEKGLPFYQGSGDFGELYPITNKWCDVPKKIAEQDDILISVRAPVGDMNVASARCVIGRGLAAIRRESVDFWYLYYAIQQYRGSFNKLSQGSTFTAINKKDLQGLLLPVPSREEQIRIQDTLKNIENKKSIENNKLEYLINLKKGLMQQLLTGKVRVPVDENEVVET